MGRIRETFEKNKLRASRIANIITPTRNGLICVKFNGLCEDYYNIDMVTDPGRFCLIKEFDEFIRHTKSENFQIVSPQDILDNKLSGRDVLIFFEGGYYNNYLAVDVLKKHNAKATFFPIPYNIKTGFAFWEDIIYRNEINRMKPERIRERIKIFSTRDNQDIIRFINEKYSEYAVWPKSDFDRPMNIEELAIFKEFDEVIIGNTSLESTPLKRHKDEVIKNISMANDFFGAICNDFPNTLYYPEGFYDDEIADEIRNSQNEIKIALCGIDGCNSEEYLSDENNLLRLKTKTFPGFKSSHREKRIEQILDIGFFE
ncbi:MAG: polysaccharide deacetylase family protein [Candidatus Zixiibacteriota bacterium]